MTLFEFFPQPNYEPRVDLAVEIPLVYLERILFVEPHLL